MDIVRGFGWDGEHSYIGKNYRKKNAGNNRVVNTLYDMLDNIK